MPYLRAKLQDYYEALGGGLDPAMLEEGRLHRQREDVCPYRLRPTFFSYIFVDLENALARGVQESLPLAESNIRSVAIVLQYCLSI